MACRQFFRSLAICLYKRVGSITIQTQCISQTPYLYAIKALLSRSLSDFKCDMPVLEPIFEFGCLTEHNSQQNPLDSLSDPIWNFSTPTRRRSKQRRMQIRMGFYGHQEFYQLKRSLVTCNSCGHWHERHTLCPNCYSTVRDETERLRALSGTLPTEFYQHMPEVRSFDPVPKPPSRVPPQSALDLRRESSPQYDREWRFLYENEPDPSSASGAPDEKASQPSRKASKASGDADSKKPSIITTSAAYFIRVPYARPDWFKPSALPSSTSAQLKSGGDAPTIAPQQVPLFSWGDGRKFVKRPRVHPRRWTYKTLHP